MKTCHLVINDISDKHMKLPEIKKNLQSVRDKDFKKTMQI